MNFYDRESELSLLAAAQKRSEKGSQMTVLFGRRRIGKTLLAMKSVESQNFVYLFVGRKNEQMLCQEFSGEIEMKLGITVLGEYKQFRQLFEFLMRESEARPFTVIIDEFQEFLRVNPSVFSDMQNIWDRYKSKSKMHLIISGSVYSLMKKIFESSKEPLFGRANERIHLKPFSVLVLKEILADHSPGWKPEDLLALFTLTGGVAKYVEIFVDHGCLTLHTMLDEIFSEHSLLLEEGKNILIEEFGRDHLTYFAILSLIASSKTSRSDIESILEKDIGGYLDRLEKEYSVITTVKPIFSKPGSRSLKYRIEDNFLNFWFRFIYKYRSAVEINNFEYLKSIVMRDFSTYSGRFLEKYFIEKLALSRKYSLIGSWWDKKSGNELDIVAVNEMNQQFLIAEVKVNAGSISLPKLKEKSATLVKSLPGYQLKFAGYSLKDM
ncbi:MAG: ATP-binding protein [Chitinophagaceae bacterium]|nr:ATP-binding protein [Chitinophagaceae bacterium]